MQIWLLANERSLDGFVAGERLDIAAGFGTNSRGVAGERNRNEAGGKGKRCWTFDFGESILWFF